MPGSLAPHRLCAVRRGRAQQTLAVAALGLALACSGSSRERAPAQVPPSTSSAPGAYPPQAASHPGAAPAPGYPAPGYPATGYPAPGYPAPGYPAPGYPATGYPAPATPPGVTGSPPVAPSSATDPIATLEIGFLRQRAQRVLAELVASLAPQSQQRVQNIPLVIDDTVGEVNAFAACSKTGASAMAITDDMLRISAILAQAHAHDEYYGLQKVDEYIRLAAAQLRPERPVPVPPSGFFPYTHDPRVQVRQHQLFDEQVAFVLGHELGHHYLNHLPCTAAPDPLGAGLAARVLADQVPLFNQPNEVAADLAGTQNLLNSGRQRATRGEYAWTETGGLLSMRFFAGFNQLSPADLLLAFERSHPPPQLRTPIIQQAANAWRGSPFPSFGF